MYAKAVYLDWSGKTFAVLCHKLDNVLHASSIAGIETVAISCLPGLCLHHKGKLQGLWGGVFVQTQMCHHVIFVQREQRENSGYILGLQ